MFDEYTAISKPEMIQDTIKEALSVYGSCIRREKVGAFTAKVIGAQLLGGTTEVGALYSPRPRLARLVTDSFVTAYLGDTLTNRQLWIPKYGYSSPRPIVATDEATIQTGWDSAQKALHDIEDFDYATQIEPLYQETDSMLALANESMKDRIIAKIMAGPLRFF